MIILLEKEIKSCRYLCGPPINIHRFGDACSGEGPSILLVLLFKKIYIANLFENWTCDID